MIDISLIPRLSGRGDRDPGNKASHAIENRFVLCMCVAYEISVALISGHSQILSFSTAAR